MSYEISKNYKNTDYNELSLELRSDINLWKKAIIMLKERIEERFFSSIDTLICIENNIDSNNRKFGFSILAVTCLLIETIQWFKNWIYNHKWKSWELIENFMKTLWFNEKISNEFYTNVRCWILHKWEVEGHKIWSVGNFIIQDWIINRTNLYYRVKKEFYIYLEELENNDNFKENFIKVMDWICKIKNN